MSQPDEYTRRAYPEGKRPSRYAVPSTPSQLDEQDQERRAQAQARRPLIAQWAPDIPTGYIHIDDAIEYMMRRWGKMLRTEMLEAFSRDETGPKWTIFGNWPDKGRGQRYYAFDDIDLWVYRTVTGVPASWRETRGKLSTVPVRRIELTNVNERKELNQCQGREGW